MASQLPLRSGATGFSATAGACSEAESDDDYLVLPADLASNVLDCRAGLCRCRTDTERLQLREQNEIAADDQDRPRIQTQDSRRRRTG